jgi:lysozyme
VTIRGIDVSAAQGVITDAHWQAIAADGIRFVYVEAGLGNDAPNKNFDAYVAGARSAGLIVGAYQFGYVLPTDPAHPGRAPEDQAQAHYQACGGLGSNAGELPVCLDLEWPDTSAWSKWGTDEALCRSWTMTYLARAKALYGRTPLVYSYPWWLSRVGLPAEVSAYPLWLASYSGGSPPAPAPWSSYAIRQTSDGGYRLPSGAPCDEDEIADDATLAGLLA